MDTYSWKCEKQVETIIVRSHLIIIIDRENI